MSEKQTEMILLDSPYTYIEEYPLTLAEGPLSETDIKKMFRDGEYGKVEYLILSGLYTFHYLNKYNLTRFLDHILKEKKWKDYSNVIKKLVQDELICTIQYGKSRFYTLYPYAYDYMHQKKASASNRHYVAGDGKEDILECASLAQWHIALTLDKDCCRSSFYRKRTLQKTEYKIPSYACLKKSYTYHVLSYCLPKNQTDMAGFLENVCNTVEAFSHHKKGKEVVLTVVVVSTLKEITAISQMVSALKEIKDRTIYFALEGNSAEFSGLSCLYYVDKTSEETQNRIKTITIKG